MSYCVHCGVELEASLRKCPLCDTPVIDPNAGPRPETGPFPKKKGDVERVGTRGVTLLISVPLFLTALLCYLLNLFILPYSDWSYLVMGICLFLWIICLPLMRGGRISPFAAIALDTLGAVLLLYLTALFMRSNRWFLLVGLPVAVFSGLLMLAVVFLTKYVSKFFVSVFIYVISAAGILCVIIDLLVHNYGTGQAGISWSGIVLVVCLIIDALLLVIVKNPGIREQVERRLDL